MPEWCICPKCGSAIDVNKKVCDKCGYKITIGEIQAQKKKLKAKIESDNFSGMVAAGICLIVVVIGIMIFFSSNSKETISNINPDVNHANSVQYGTSGEAYMYAKHFVKDRLKSSSSAEFASVFDSKMQRVNNQWIVLSYVDSKNIYGVMVRTRYKATLKYNGDLSWTLLKLEIID